MNTLKTMRNITLGALLTMPIAAFSAAEQGPSTTTGTAQPAKMLVYINPSEFSHSVKLMAQYNYYGYWFNQGPTVAPIVSSALQAQFGDVGMCEGNSSANTVVWIKPSMFYNPLMEIYYGKIVAEVYSGSGKLLRTFTAESQRAGYLDVNTYGNIKAAYHKAMANVVKQMSADQTLQDEIMKAAASNESKLPCAMVSMLPVTK